MVSHLLKAWAIHCTHFRFSTAPVLKDGEPFLMLCYHEKTKKNLEVFEYRENFFLN